jgi:hypothetical protein
MDNFLEAIIQGHLLFNEHSGAISKDAPDVVSDIFFILGQEGKILVKINPFPVKRWKIQREFAVEIQKHNRAEQAQFHGYVIRQVHTYRNGLTVLDYIVSNGLDGVAEGMPIIEFIPLVPVEFVDLDDGFFDLQAFPDMSKAMRPATDHQVIILEQFMEKGAAGIEIEMQDLTDAGLDVTDGKCIEKRDIYMNFGGWIEIADEIFLAAEIYGCFTADAAVSLGKKCRWEKGPLDASVNDGRAEGGNILNNPAAHCHQLFVSAHLPVN